MGTPKANEFHHPGITTYAAWHLWNIAADAAKRARETKRAVPRACTADTVTSIILAAACTEAFINELGDIARIDTGVGQGDANWAEIGKILSDFEEAKAPVTLKYLYLSKLLRAGKRLDSSQEPFQGFKRLLDVRNRFVHPRAQAAPPRFFRWFADQGWTYNAGTDQVKLSGWMYQLETPQVASWGCRTAHAIVWHFLEQLEQENINPIHYRIPKKQWERGRNDERVRRG